VSRDHIVHLKGQGDRHFWPDKVAVLHAWSRKGQSPGCCQSGGANDRPDYSNGREFTVISPELLRPAGWDCLRRQGGTAYAGRVGLLTPAGWDCLRRQGGTAYAGPGKRGYPV